MDFMNKLERKFGKYAIPNLMNYIIALYILGYVLLISQKITGIDLYSAFLSLNFKMIFKGQIWRLVTYVIQPPSTSIIFIFFALYLSLTVCALIVIPRSRSISIESNTCSVISRLSSPPQRSIIGLT